MLTEIRDGLQQVGKKVEPTESDFHLEQLRTIEELQMMEVNLQDEEKKDNTGNEKHITKTTNCM